MRRLRPASIWSPSRAFTRCASTVALVFAALFTGCARATAPAVPRTFAGAPVILISIDTLRADRLPLYGYSSGVTPALDRIGREGIVLEDLYSHAPLTLPSHTSLLTGLLPFHHGVRDNIGFTVRPGERTLAMRFKAAGYATGAAVSSFVLRRQTGIAQGFDFFDDAIEMAGTGESLSDTRRDGRRSVDALAAWIERQPTDRLFAFLHLYEPHAPYAPPPTHRMADAYEGTIAYADELVGVLLGRLAVRGLADRAVIVIVSDHGEGLGDHGEAEHGIFLYREALHVPGIIRLPKGADGGARLAGTFGTVDLTATLLELAALPVDGLDGHPLGATLTARRTPDRSVYSETLYPRFHFGWSDLASLTDGRYRFIRAPRPELYDLQGDPGERRNLADSKRSTASALGTSLEQMLAGSQPGNPAEVPADVRERLKALGYVGSSPAPAPGAALPDPKDTIGAYETLKRGLALAGAGRDADAVAQFRALVAANPRMLDGWEALAKSLVRTGRMREAIDAFGKVIEIDPLKPETHLALARIYALGRQADRARQHAQLAARRDPAAAYETLAGLAMDDGQLGEATDLARRSVEADPSRYMSHFYLGAIAQRQGRCPDAIAAFQRAIEAKRNEPKAVVRNLHAGLADCLARTDRPADAEREFQAELNLIPSSPEARVGLATLYRSQSRDADTRAVLAGLVTNTPQPTADTYWTVVRTFTVLGDTDAAREWAAKARGRFPRDARFR